MSSMHTFQLYSLFVNKQCYSCRFWCFCSPVLSLFLSSGSSLLHRWLFLFCVEAMGKEKLTALTTELDYEALEALCRSKFSCHFHSLSWNSKACKCGTWPCIWQFVLLLVLKTAAPTYHGTCISAMEALVDGTFDSKGKTARKDRSRQDNYFGHGSGGTRVKEKTLYDCFRSDRSVSIECEQSDMLHVKSSCSGWTGLAKETQM